MAFTPTNYLRADRALDQIAEEATRHFQVMDQGVTNLERAASSLLDMQTTWGAAVTFIDDQAAAAPLDEQWAALKARKDKMVTDFLAMRDLAIAVRDAAQTARG